MNRRALVRLASSIGRVVGRGVLPALVAFAAAAADMSKTLHVAFPVAETGFDPQAIGDTYSDAICLAIFDPLYRYDYFARPVQLEPNTADGLPIVSDDGRSTTASRPALNSGEGENLAIGDAFRGAWLSWQPQV